MIRHVGKWLFPNDQRSARRRKMQIIYLTIFGGLAAGALIALTFIWVYYSRRF